MVIMHKYPLAVVKHLGLRRCSKALQYSFAMISRNILRKDNFKVLTLKKAKP